ncbi:MAG: hypothetical protein ACFE0Q_00055 [Anaerolineae bacterium]
MKPYYLRLLDDGRANNVPDVYRHWCDRSETFAGADALLTKLQQGYAIETIVICHTVRVSESRLSEIYHFRLTEHNESHVDIHLDMPVLRNPFVMRLIQRLDLQVHRPKPPEQHRDSNYIVSE